MLFTGSTRLRVTQTSPAALKALVLIGACFVQGKWFEVYSEEEQLAVATPDPTLPRIDRAVVRLGHTNREVVLAMLSGTLASSPAPPALTRDSSRWELSLARVRVAAGTMQTLDSNVTDERFDPSGAGLSRPLSHLLGASNAAVAVRNTTNATILHDIDTKIQWKGVDYMTENSIWSVATPGRVYAPYPGLYLCLFRCMWAAHPTASRYTAMRRNNLDRLALDIRPGKSVWQVESA